MQVLLVGRGTGKTAACGRDGRDLSTMKLNHNTELKQEDKNDQLYENKAYADADLLTEQTHLMNKPNVRIADLPSRLHLSKNIFPRF